MRNIVRDIKTTANLFRLVRQATKSGKDVQIKTVYSIPAVNIGCWGFTPEACLFHDKKWNSIVDVFCSFDEETQRALTFAPKNGEWVERIRFWQRELLPVLEPKMYHEAILILVQWSIRCIKKREVGHG